MAFTYNSVTEEEKRRNRKRRRNRKVWTKPSLSASSSIFFCLFLLSLKARDETFHTAGQLWTSSINLKAASRSSWLASLVFWSVTQINHVNRARVLVGCQLPTHVCQSFTRQIRVYQHEKVGEKVGENRSKFYLSRTVCQRVCRLFLCRSHTPTWVCQHEFANFSLPLYALLSYRSRKRAQCESVLHCRIIFGSVRFSDNVGCITKTRSRNSRKWHRNGIISHSLRGTEKYTQLPKYIQSYYMLNH